MNNDRADLERLFSNGPIRVEDSRYFFRSVDRASEVGDHLDRLKLGLKRWERPYRLAVRWLSPVWGNRKPQRRFLASCSGVVVNIGSGNHRVAPHVINVDMFDYPAVDVVADIHELPFRDSSIDGIMSVAVLEHVKNPQAVITEMYRVLKPGGKIYNLIPFMQPFHASPHDYQRYTLPGIRYLHRDFEIIESGVCGGPVSGFLWVFQEWIATLLSFGSIRLRNMLYLAVMLFTWPLKFLDLIFARLPTATNIASSFYVLGSKPGANSH